MKFKVGDKVRIVRILDNITSQKLIGLEGIIREVDPLLNGDFNYYVDSHYMHEEELELVEMETSIHPELSKLQAEVKEWSSRNFPDAKPYQPLLGAVEELGELAHAHLKMEQGIRQNESLAEQQVDAVGDIIIYLADYCWRNGLSLHACVYYTWQIVKTRDWKRDRIDGTGTNKSSS